MIGGFGGIRGSLSLVVVRGRGCLVGLGMVRRIGWLLGSGRSARHSALPRYISCEIRSVSVSRMILEESISVGLRVA